jgi:hypothetical protein
MGLDQNAYKVKSDYNSDSRTETTTKTELHYWRKHNRLQGWMEELWRSKGGTGEFNLVDVRIDEEDLESLEQTILDRELPETGGFFFGNDSYEDYEGEYGYKDSDLEFIKKAKEAMSGGWRIVYSCWW